MDFTTKFLLALCIWRESRGESEKVWYAIYNVILNRVGEFGKTIIEVIVRPFAFSSFNAWHDSEGHPHFDVNVNHFPIEKNVQEFEAWTKILKMLDIVQAEIGAVADRIDPTQMAMFYESEPTPPDATRYPWFKPSNITLTLPLNNGREMRFYKQ